MYYPFYLHLINWWSFAYHNEQIGSGNTKLWSISRWSYPKYKGNKTFTASYNNYTQNYEFNGKRYLLYEEVIRDALRM